VSAGAAHGRAQRGAIEIFAKIDQREEGVERARLQFVGEMQAACGDARKQFAAPRDVMDDFELALASGVAKHGFPAHLGASAFNFNHEVQDAKSLSLDRWGDTDVASCRFADGGHEVESELECLLSGCFVSAQCLPIKQSMDRRSVTAPLRLPV
jgi:hypothetical protein